MVRHTMERKNNKKKKISTLVALFLAAVLVLSFLLLSCQGRQDNLKGKGSIDSTIQTTDGVPDFIDVELLSISKYARPGKLINKVNDIVIHYTANPGTSAMDNRNYFENLKDTKERKASAHFIVDQDGSVVQCIPTKEIAYAVNNRNYDTISIECCYNNEDGSFEKATYDSVVRLTAWLLQKNGLSADHVIRHYDITGKRCPLYYVEHEDEWKTLLNDIADVKSRLDVR